jgi:SH3-like domain-containing protein
MTKAMTNEQMSEKRISRRYYTALAMAMTLAVAPGSASGQTAGLKLGAGGLQIPRFVSLKSDEVNVRQGPGWDHAVTWVFRRAGLPVEVLAEFESWRQVRDSEGATGWVFSTLLSGRRTSLVAPGKKSETSFPLYDRPDAAAPLNANLQSGVLVNIKSCNGRWCNVTVNNANGWIDQNALWGVYPNEAIN